MQFGQFFALLCLYFYQCNGAPPGEVSQKHGSKARYTKEENELIIEEISRLSVHNQHIYAQSVWENVAEKHLEKWEQDTPGFPRERSWEALRSHFRQMVMSDHSQMNISMPAHLLQRCQSDLNQQSRGRREHYNPEENELIIEELSKPSCTNPFASTTLNAICARHNEKRLSNTRGFGNGRTVNSIRSHILRMKQNNELPEEVVEKCWGPEED